jgi:hypothetical protein
MYLIHTHIVLIHIYFFKISVGRDMCIFSSFLLLDSKYLWTMYCSVIAENAFRIFR